MCNSKYKYNLTCIYMINAVLKHSNLYLLKKITPKLPGNYLLPYPIQVSYYITHSLLPGITGYLPNLPGNYLK